MSKNSTPLGHATDGKLERREYQLSDLKRPRPVSNCCGAPTRIPQTGTTMYYICTRCEQACGIAE